MKKNYTLIICTLMTWGLLLTSCEDFLQVGAPRNELVRASVFEEDATANAALVDVYFELARMRFASGDRSSMTLIGALLSDEQLHFITGAGAQEEEFAQFAANAIVPTNSIVGNLWIDLYKTIYKANAALEGIEASEGMTDTYRSQLSGEARFIRAFCYFHLVNLFGDVPLVLSTPYQENTRIGRSPQAAVYQQIVSDLTQAQGLMVDAYSMSNNERVRCNKGAATALLARVYLFLGDWASAEIQASTIIQNTTQYRLATNVTDVFRTTSQEAIWQLWRSSAPNERVTFIPSSPTSPKSAVVRPSIATSFEAGDRRYTSWIGRLIVGANTYYYTNKYVSAGTPPLDYSTVLRVAEQYLIRAEARAQQGKIAESVADLNVLRARAGLGNSSATNVSALLIAVDDERTRELLGEWGHRWFDLKRTGKLDAVLAPLKTGWKPTAALLPIPEVQLQNDPGMAGQQNPGY